MKTGGAYRGYLGSLRGIQKEVSHQSESRLLRLRQLHTRERQIVKEPEQLIAVF
jgi:hypothetical protein